MEYIIVLLIFIVIVLSIKLENRNDKIKKLSYSLNLVLHSKLPDKPYIIGTYYSILFRKALLEIQDLNDLVDAILVKYNIDFDSIIEAYKNSGVVSMEFPRNLKEHHVKLSKIKENEEKFKVSYEKFRKSTGV